MLSLPYISHLVCQDEQFEILTSAINRLPLGWTAINLIEQATQDLFSCRHEASSEYQVAPPPLGNGGYLPTLTFFGTRQVYV